MKNEEISCCGLDCWACPAYIATKTDDPKLREQTAAKWTSDDFPVTANDIDCAGCQSEVSRWKFCSVCQVRSCATEKGFSTCAECAAFACDKLEGILQMVGGEARARLEGMRSGPQA